MLTTPFSVNVRESLQMVSDKVWAVFSKKCAQIECMLKLNELQIVFLDSTCAIDNRSWQNRPFLRVFAHFLA